MLFNYTERVFTIDRPQGENLENFILLHFFYSTRGLRKKIFTLRKHFKSPQLNIYSQIVNLNVNIYKDSNVIKIYVLNEDKAICETKIKFKFLNEFSGILLEHGGIYVFRLQCIYGIKSRQDGIILKHPFPRFHLAFMQHQLLFPFLFLIQDKVLM